MIAVQGMLKGLTHCKKAEFSLLHIQIILGVDMLTRMAKSRVHPRVTDIAGVIGVPEAKFRKEMDYLLEKRYLHEFMPTYGDSTLRYKIGSVGGTLMRQFLSAGRLKADLELSD